MKSTLRNGLSRLAKSVLRRYGFKLYRAPRVLIDRPDACLRPSIEMLCAYHALRNKACRYLHIGAFDGITGDPIGGFIHQLGWQGILVEPQPERFHQLRENLRHIPGLAFVNAAIAHKSGTIQMYRVRSDLDSLPGLPTPLGRDWLDQISSLDARTITRNLAYCCPDIDVTSYLETFEVTAMTIDDILLEHRWSSVDLVQIDAEGFDYEIIRMIDLEKMRPAIINYEHHHLVPADRDACALHLVEHGYQLSVQEMDTVAYRSTNANVSCEPDDVPNSLGRSAGRNLVA